MTVSGDASVYRLGFAHVLRLVGPAVIALGAGWLIVAALGASGIVRGLAALFTVVVVAAAAILVLRPPRVLQLTEVGFRVSWVRGVGEPAAPWTAVESVGTQPVGGAVSLVIELNGGRSSVLPLSLLGARNVEAQREVHQRLNNAHGYRRI